jgi:hypothetical protein
MTVGQFPVAVKKPGRIIQGPLATDRPELMAYSGWR